MNEKELTQLFSGPGRESYAYLVADRSTGSSLQIQVKIFVPESRQDVAILLDEGTPKTYFLYDPTSQKWEPADRLGLPPQCSLNLPAPK